MNLIGTDVRTPQELHGHTSEGPTESGIGVYSTFPFSESSLWPSALLSNLDLRRPGHTGILLDNCWNARVRDCFIHGNLALEQYANPTEMAVGIDLVGSMDAHLTNMFVTSAAIGLRAMTHPDQFPRCEGLHITDGVFMHTNIGIQLLGSHLGGWPTPVTHIVGPHITFNIHAIHARDQAFLHLDRVNCYGNEFTKVKWAIYLANCRNVTITDCDFWTNWHPDAPGFFGGIVLQNCEDVTITDGTFISSINLALYADKTNRRVRTNGKVWDELAKQGKVVNESTR